MARTTLSSVSAVLNPLLERDVAQAAQGNTLLSKAEQAKAKPHVREAAEALRGKKKNARVTVDALETELESRAQKLIASANQPQGPGSTTLSEREAQQVAAQGGSLGQSVHEAYKVAAGRGLDVDAIARQRAGEGEPDQVFKLFTTEAEAVAYQDPDGNQVAWLVVRASGPLSKSYTSGRNDLWGQRFEIDRITGAITITGEH